MKMNGMKTVVFLFSLCWVCGASAEPSISQVTVRQRWPWSRLVDIDYVLASDAGEEVDIVVQAFNGDTPLELPSSSLSGDLNGVSYGARHIVWDPTATAYAEIGVLPEFRVTLVPEPAKTYMLVNLASSLADTTEARISYTNVVIGSGNQWDDLYKTNYIVLRRIQAGTFTMGSPAAELHRATGDAEKQHQVTLTKNYYIGVFQVTQFQYNLLMNARPSFFTADWETRPVERLAWYTPRGIQTWPSEDPAVAHAVTEASFFGQLRKKTGNAFVFDYPTDAQWEYACRAGTTSGLYNGTELTCAYGAATDVNVDLLARYAGNGGSSNVATVAASVGGTAKVGSYEPNDWGLYDMYGNVWEWCLDWYAVFTEDAVVDPVGAPTGSFRLRRGGSLISGPSALGNRCASAARSNSTVGDNGRYAGFRVSATLP